MTRKMSVLFLVYLLCFPTFTFSQSSSQKEEEAFRKIEEIRKRVGEMQQKDLEELKMGNPALYQERMRMKDTSQKISEILTAFRRGSLSEGEARRKLMPLVRQSLKSRVENLNQEFERVSKRLEYLRKAKANPDLLVNDQIDRYLGKGSAREELPFLY